MVVGSGGAGKTTLARRLAASTGLPLTHLDHEFWNPGWVKTPTEPWHGRVAELAAEDRWILEGNYGGSAHLRLVRADTVVFLDFGRLTCMRRALTREIRNWGTCSQAPGCPERFSAEFLEVDLALPEAGSGSDAERHRRARVGRAGHQLAVRRRGRGLPRRCRLVKWCATLPP